MLQLRSKTLLTAALVAALSSSALADPFTFTATDTPVSAVDNVTNPIVSTITIGPSQAGTINDVNVFINVASGWQDDLDIFVSHVNPDTLVETKVQLTKRDGNSGTGSFTDTLFDDSAGTAVSAGSSPFAGSYRPLQALSAFNGQNVYGTWTLTVFDNVAAGETNTINSFQISGSFNPAPIPEPGTFALFGLGAIGLVGLVRKRRKVTAPAA